MTVSGLENTKWKMKILLLPESMAPLGLVRTMQS